jgi:hypothetical protein
MPAGAPPPMTTLVVMQAAAPGWSFVGPDGQSKPAGNVGGYLAIPGARPGQEYTLRYLPASFVRGGLISVVGLVCVAGLCWLELRRQPLLRRIGVPVPARRQPRPRARPYSVASIPR